MPDRPTTVETAMRHEPSAQPLHGVDLICVERLLRLVFGDAAPATRPIPGEATD